MGPAQSLPLFVIFKVNSGSMVSELENFLGGIELADDDTVSFLSAYKSCFYFRKKNNEAHDPKKGKSFWVSKLRPSFQGSRKMNFPLFYFAIFGLYLF